MYAAEPNGMTGRAEWEVKREQGLKNFQRLSKVQKIN
jgi:hypothetical protein